MRDLRGFGDFLKDGTVRKRPPDMNRAEFLVKEAESRKLFMESIIRSTPAEEMYQNFIIESCYDIMIEIVRAKMLMDGYDSDSHEAEVSYMAKIGFSAFEVRFADDLRHFRNGIKYYGRRLDKEYADKVLEFLKRVYPKLKKAVQPF